MINMLKVYSGGHAQLCNQAYTSELRAPLCSELPTDVSENIADLKVLS